MKKVLFFACFAALFACETVGEPADLLLFNANIYTVNDSFDTAEALAVNEGKIIAVGSNEEIQEKYQGDKVIDANGKTVIPGLIDAHCHFYGLGLNQLKVDLVGTGSYEEVLERVKYFQDQNPSNFIQGRGWDQNDWEVKEFPTKEELDALFPDIPVALERVDGHAYLVNQKALDLAGITDATTVQGGEIIKKNGKISGVLIDNPMA
ncbi:MAG: amidohydrolase family protein, partial [Flavobacteriaceae bacterium]|nr:amidohydrolase family protein [Muriicola sp.]NNL39354.1 amidohydrolase family protein [Flavobacteriaceae bacterium]